MDVEKETKGSVAPDVTKDIQDILDGMQPVPVSQPIVEEKPTSSEESRVEQPNPEAPAAETKAEDVKPPNEVEFLRQELQRVSAILVEIQGKSAETKKAPELQDQDFIGDEEDVNEILSGREQLNALMNKIRKQSVADARELVLSEVDSLIGPEVDRRVERKLLIERFYDANPDLQDKRDYVSFIGSQVIAGRPEITYEEFFTELEKKAREVFPKTVSKSPESAPLEESSSPGFASAGGARASVPANLDRMQKDIADIMFES